MIDLAASVEEQRSGQGVEVPGLVKTASDLARYRVILERVRPAWVIELGTSIGASACWLAVVGACKVVTVDTEPQVTERRRQRPDIVWVHGNSADPAVVEHVRRVVAGDGPVMVSCDSDHSAAHVLIELQSYGPLVTPGSYMVVEDGVIRWIPEQLPFYRDSSPLDAIELFLAERPDEWVIDVALEDMSPTTQCPSGWLRKAG